MSNEPLKYEVHGEVGGEKPWFRLYECEHVTDNTYPISDAIPIGDHTNLILCKHCLEGFTNRVAKEMLESLLRGMKPAELAAYLAEYAKADTLSLQSASDRDRLEKEGILGSKAPHVESGTIQREI